MNGFNFYLFIIVTLFAIMLFVVIIALFDACFLLKMVKFDLFVLKRMQGSACNNYFLGINVELLLCMCWYDLSTVYGVCSCFFYLYFVLFTVLGLDE